MTEYPKLLFVSTIIAQKLGVTRMQQIPYLELTLASGHELWAVTKTLEIMNAHTQNYLGKFKPNDEYVNLLIKIKFPLLWEYRIYHAVDGSCGQDVRFWGLPIEKKE